ncbi:hypothetical protein EJ377_19095 [Chryseobacterium arthrosphaerae]|uniref:Uncharacterized protein n=1 Tax=Chryseobacterium arthrosphaerae TaxID=651561 RepID=A0A3S0N281_9FLAO|nr:hypothetical protein EJ377_19095 [Chryseobacterium arthrosphaerae]
MWSLCQQYDKNLWHHADSCFADGHVIGVIELGSTSNFEEDRISYFEECSVNIGIALNAAKGREKNSSCSKKPRHSLKNYRCSTLSLKPQYRAGSTDPEAPGFRRRIKSTAGRADAG